MSHFIRLHHSDALRSEPSSGAYSRSRRRKEHAWVGLAHESGTQVVSELVGQPQPQGQAEDHSHSEQFLVLLLLQYTSILS
jgi:hypothetical protein